MTLERSGFTPGSQFGGDRPTPPAGSYDGLLLPPAPTGPALPIAPPVPANDAVIPPRVFLPEQPAAPAVTEPVEAYEAELAAAATMAHGRAAVLTPTIAPVLHEVPGTHPLPVRRGVGARGTSTRRGDIAVTIAGIGLGMTTAMAVAEAPNTWQYAGGPMTALGSIAAMAGTYLCLALLVLVARVPWIEREVGHDRLVALHRKVAPYSIGLISLHVLLTTLGYAQAAEEGPVAEFVNIILHSAWMVPALAAFVMFFVLGVISYRKIRARMRYETWWATHLYFYLAIALGFGHQLELGAFFATHPAQKWFWVGVYVVAFGLIIGSRFVLPMAMSMKHDLRVGAVVRESPDVVSIYLTGRDLDLLKARGGQFFQWRFMTRQWWWQAHPYSLSAAPNSSWLRITVKDLGDQSGALVDFLRPGVRVWAEGPYGVFTAAHRTTERIAAFAAGVGITPIRAMLEDLPEGTQADIVFRVRSVETAPLRAEMEELAMSRGFRLWYLEGSRRQAKLRTDVILEMVPDLADCDVYVCGPAEFTEKVLDAARSARVPESRLHHEAFSF